MPSTSTERVPAHTRSDINERIGHETALNVMHYWAQGPDAVNSRLRELDREWDIERTIEANAATISLIGIIFGVLLNSLWFVLPAIVAAFLLQHALQGWCPPVPVLRRLGFRTVDEIGYERYALKVLRGDFRESPQMGEPFDGARVARLMESVKKGKEPSCST